VGEALDALRALGGETEQAVALALVALRRLGREGADAIQAVLSVRRVATLRASWQLWEALAEGDGEEPEDLLLKALPLHVLERARRALWGSTSRDSEQASPRLRIAAYATGSPS
jgi:hypothetical protein